MHVRAMSEQVPFRLETGPEAARAPTQTLPAQFWEIQQSRARTRAEDGQ
jgi:hypothetical protein